MREQMSAGLNTLTGGPGIEYAVDSTGKVSGDNAIKLIKIAQKYGAVKAIVSYGGFLGLNPDWDFKAVAAGLKEFEEKNQLPPTYINSYDEPNTEAEKTAVLKGLVGGTAAGLKTIGWTSWHADGDELWNKILTNSYAPALNSHDAENIRQVKALGRHP